MLGKLSAALALVAAADAFKLEPVTKMAQHDAEYAMAQLNADAAQDAGQIVAAPETATTATDAEAAEPAATGETEDVVEEEAAPEVEPTPAEKAESDVPAGSIHLTISMGAAIALLVTSAF